MVSSRAPACASRSPPAKANYTGCGTAHANSSIRPFPSYHGEYSATVTMVNIGRPIYRIMHFYDPPKTFKNHILIKIKYLWA